jgi:hypothetical protein
MVKSLWFLLVAAMPHCEALFLAGNEDIGPKKIHFQGVNKE